MLFIWLLVLVLLDKIVGRRAGSGWGAVESKVSSCSPLAVDVLEHDPQPIISTTFSLKVNGLAGYGGTLGRLISN